MGRLEGYFLADNDARCPEPVAGDRGRRRFFHLALFPAVTAVASLYGIFASEETIGGRLSFLAGMMPAGAYSIVQEQIARIVAKGDARLSFAFVISLGLALWRPNAGIKAMIDALNVVDVRRSEVSLF
jgi:membrane protein